MNYLKAHLARMERSGMQWTLVNAKSLLNLRATIASGHWDEFLAHRQTTGIRQFPPHREALANYLPVLTF